MIQWITPPSKLGQAIQDYEKRCRVALYAAANAWGQRSQDDARREAVWEDRTGNARGGLFFAVDGFGLGTVQGDVKAKDGEKSETVSISGDDEHLVITLGHTMFYGKFLELANGGRFAIILSTIERNLPALERAIQNAYGH